MKVLFFEFIMFTMFFLSCKNPNEQLEFFNKSLRNEHLKPLVSNLTNGLRDTLNNWAYVKKYENIQGLAKDKWVVDGAVFLNPSKNKAILLVLEQDTAKYTTVPTGDGGTEITKPTSFDYISLIYANKENGKWYYYYQSMALFVISRTNKENGVPIPLTFEELSLTGRRNILMSYYKYGTCRYNDKFFDRWDIENLKEQHKKINGYY
jgi:hypothetical protein